MSAPRGVRDLFPVAFGVAPVLSVYAAAAGTFTMAELLIGLAVAAALAAAVQLGVFAALRDRSKSAVLTSLLLILAGTYGYGLHLTHALLAGTSIVGRTRFALPVWTLAAGACVWWVARGSLRAERWAGVLAYAASGVLMVTLTACGLALAHGSRQEEVERLRGGVGRESLGRRPDVFVLVLDEYASTRTLRDVFGFDNTPFVTALESRGFRVGDAQAAYSQTQLSVASLLNLRYLSPLDVDRGRALRQAYLGALIYDNALFRLFKRADYEVQVFWSGLLVTSHFRNADLSGSCFRLGSLAYAVALRTIVSPFLWLFRKPGDGVVCVLGRLGSQDRSASPRLVFAHVIAPHPPAALKSDCSPVPGARAGWEAAPRPRRAYVEQVRCVNRLVLEFVDRALRRSGGGTVIVILGDHGPGSLLGPEDGRNWREPSAAMLSERMEVLTAYYVGDRAIAGSALRCAGPVNSVRVIAGAALDTVFPSIPERSYYSNYPEPFRLADVSTLLPCSRERPEPMGGAEARSGDSLRPSNTRETPRRLPPVPSDWAR